MVLRQVGIFDPQKVKLRVAHGPERIVFIVGHAEAAPLGQRRNRDQCQREESRRLHRDALIVALAGGRLVPCSLISVIIVNWNRRDLLRACLESLRKQRDAEFEVIVVDNGSTDASADLAESFGALVIRNGQNRGFCAANNQGIAAARGDLIALLNNDAEAEPGWLAALAGAFSSADVGMAASKILVYEEPTRIDKAGHLIYPDGQNRGRGTGAVDRGQFDSVEECLWPDGCAAMYRKSMLDEIGGFDEDFFAYADDAELGLRARIAGWRCVYAPRAVVRHHRGATLGKDSGRRLELIERNRVL